MKTTCCCELDSIHSSVFSQRLKLPLMVVLLVDLATTLLIAILGWCIHAHAQFECQRTLNYTDKYYDITATYDLCGFRLHNESYPGYYTVYDNKRGNWETLNDIITNYTFYFNVAANIPLQTPDEICDNYTDGMHTGYCNDINWEGQPNATCDPNNLVPINTVVAAYKVRDERFGQEAACWRLHDGITPAIWTFLNEFPGRPNPALGIQLTYTNGDWCPEYGKNREFKIRFKCSNNEQITPDLDDPVYEPIGDGCSYELTMGTIKGCPTQCIVNNGEICSG